MPAMLTVFLFLYVAAEASYGDWIYTYALARSLAGQVTAGYLTSAYWGSFTVGRLAAVAAALRVRPAPLLALSLAGAIASLTVLLALPGGSAAWVATIALRKCSGACRTPCQYDSPSPKISFRASSFSRSGRKIPCTARLMDTMAGAVANSLMG